MTKVLTIDEQDIPFLVDFYKGKRVRLLKELEAVDKMLSTLSNDGSNSITSPARVRTSPVDEYPMSATWSDKLKYLVGAMDNPTASEIVDKIINLEPSREGSRSSLLPTISGKLAELSEKGFFKRDRAIKGYVYSMQA